MAHGYHSFAAATDSDATPQHHDEIQSPGAHRTGPETPGEILPKTAWKEENIMENICRQRKSGQGNRSMLLKRTKKFCSEASVVGLRYVANPTASPIRRCVWLVLILAGAAFTTFQIQDRIRYFLSRPVSVNFRIEHAEEIRFPTVTICNENRVMYSAAQYLGR